jgi:hypothetical protein
MPPKGLPVQLRLICGPIGTIVLLPFKSLGDDQDAGAALAEGLRIDIQNALIKMSGVFLLGAGSANAMRSGQYGRRSAGRRALCARRWCKDRVRQCSSHDRWFRAGRKATIVFRSQFRLQDEITARIVTALDIKLASGEQARIWHKCLTDPEAREFFCRGIQAFFRMNAESMANARACFARVVELAPDSPYGATWSPCACGLNQPEAGLPIQLRHASKQKLG